MQLARSWAATARANVQNGKAGGKWTVHNVQNLTLLGHSPPASQAGRRVGPAP